MSVDRNIKSIKVYASTTSASLKINDLTFQENVQPKEPAANYIPTPYAGFNFDTDGWELGYDPISSTPYESGFVLTLDPTLSTGFKWAAGGAAFALQFSLGGRIFPAISAGPALIIPRACTVTSIYAHTLAGSCTYTLSHGPIVVGVGTVLAMNDTVTINVISASVDCQGLSVQLRFV